MTGGQIYYAFELEESTLPYVIQRIGADKLLYSSDYPHWDSSWPNTVKLFMSREDVPAADKHQIAWDNPQGFYGFKAALG